MPNFGAGLRTHCGLTTPYRISNPQRMVSHNAAGLRTRCGRGASTTWSRWPTAASWRRWGSRWPAARASAPPCSPRWRRPTSTSGALRAQGSWFSGLRASNERLRHHVLRPGEGRANINVRWACPRTDFHLHFRIPQQWLHSPLCVGVRLCLIRGHACDWSVRLHLDQESCLYDGSLQRILLNCIGAILTLLCNATGPSHRAAASTTSPSWWSRQVPEHICLA